MSDHQHIVAFLKDARSRGVVPIDEDLDDLAERWDETGFDAVEVKAWLDAGVYDPNTASWCDDHDASPRVVAHLDAHWLRSWQAGELGAGELERAIASAQRSDVLLERDRRLLRFLEAFNRWLGLRTDVPGELQTSLRFLIESYRDTTGGE